jgi:hypothetical protein
MLLDVLVAVLDHVRLGRVVDELGGGAVTLHATVQAGRHPEAGGVPSGVRVVLRVADRGDSDCKCHGLLGAAAHLSLHVTRAEEFADAGVVEFEVVSHLGDVGESDDHGIDLLVLLVGHQPVTRFSATSTPAW